MTTGQHQFGGDGGMGTQGNAFEFNPPVAAVATPPTIESLASQHGVEEVQDKWMVRHARKIGAVAVGVALATSAYFLLESNDTTSASADKTEQAGNSIANMPKEDVCPNGIFDKDSPMALAEQVRPGDLHARPIEEIKTDDLFSKYMFGEKKDDKEAQKGVLCALPTDLAVYQTIFDNWVGGEGSGSRPFGNILQGANSLADFYKTNPEEADKALNNTNFKGFIGAMTDNKDVINAGTYFEITLVDGKIVQTKVDLNEIKPGQVRTLGNKVWVNDTSFDGNGQIVIQSNVDGKLYVLNALGDTPIVAPNTTTTTEAPAGSSTTDQQNNGGAAANSSNGNKGQQNGGGGNNGNTQGNVGTGGAAGPNRTNPEAGPGGVTSSPAVGNVPGTTPGTSPAPGKPEVTPHPIPTTPKVTTPPATQPPATQPPVTTPPETQPKGTEVPVTSPGGGTAPN